jgi:hypothetical protein
VVIITDGEADSHGEHIEGGSALNQANHENASDHRERVDGELLSEVVHVFLIFSKYNQPKSLRVRGTVLEGCFR